MMHFYFCILDITKKSRIGHILNNHYSLSSIFEILYSRLKFLT